MSSSNFQLSASVKTALMEYLTNRFSKSHPHRVSTEPLGFEVWKENGKPYDWVLAEYSEILHNGKDVRIYAFTDVGYGSNVALCVESAPTGDTASPLTIQCAFGYDTATVYLDLTTAVTNVNYETLSAPFEQYINIVTMPSVTKFTNTSETSNA